MKLLFRRLCLFFYECSFPSIQSEQQPAGTKDGASGSRTGVPHGGHCCSQREPLPRTGEGGCWLRFLLERPSKGRMTGGWRAFAAQNDVVGRQPCPTQGITDRLITLSLPFRGAKFATIIISAGAQMTSSEGAKDKSSEDLNVLPAAMPKRGKLPVLLNSVFVWGQTTPPEGERWVPKEIGGSNDNAPPPPPDQHLLPPTDVRESDLDAPPIAVLAAAGRRSRPAVTKAIGDVDGRTAHRLLTYRKTVQLRPRKRPQGKPPSGRLNTILLTASISPIA
ncbi:hypothetical protein SprV_0501881600 [Sparganum proliferum]